MNETQQYVRVGTNYYKRVRQPLISGDFLDHLTLWNKETIRQDHSDRMFLSNIEKYDGFCCIPDHLNYQERHGQFLNIYHPIQTSPIPGEYHQTYAFLQHIFGEQIKLGMDYLTLLLRQPTQKLPVLCLVSQERSTGKTTFLNFLKNLFGSNMTYNKNEDFRSQFNADWTGKLIIAVDEVELNKPEDTELIKTWQPPSPLNLKPKEKTV